MGGWAGIFGEVGFGVTSASLLSWLSGIGFFQNIMLSSFRMDTFTDRSYIGPSFAG